MALPWSLLLFVCAARGLTVTNDMYVVGAAYFLSGSHFSQGATFADSIHQTHNPNPIRVDHTIGVTARSWRFSVAYYHQRAVVWSESYTDFVAGVTTQYANDPGGSKYESDYALDLLDVDEGTPTAVTVNGTAATIGQFVTSGTAAYTGQTFVIESYTFEVTDAAQGLLLARSSEQCAVYINDTRIIVSLGNRDAVGLLDVYAGDTVHFVYAVTGAAAGLAVTYQYGFMHPLVFPTPLYAPVPARFSGFGDSLSLDAAGSLMAVGDPLEDAGGTARGTVYVYARTGSAWSLRDRIAWDTHGAITAENNMRFGTVVHLTDAGTGMLVSAPLEDAAGTDRGCVYYFTYAAAVWTVDVRLCAGDLGIPAENGMQFGLAAWINSSAGSMWVSAPYHDAGLPDAGSVFYLTYSGTWTLSATMNGVTMGGITSQSNNYLGTALALNAAGDIAFLGTPGYSNQQGRVYIVKNTAGTWSVLQVIDGPTGFAGTPWFGQALALCRSTDTLVVASPEEDLGGTNRGEVYVYDTTPSWTLTQTLTPGVFPGIPTENDALFGSSVACSASGTDIMVAAETENAGAVRRGAVYALRHNTSAWILGQRITATANSELGMRDDARLGSALALSDTGERAVINEAWDVAYRAFDDHVHVYVQSNSTWTQEQHVRHSLTAFSPVGWYGSAIAVSDDGKTVVVGAPREDSGGTERGAVYIYALILNQWTLQLRVSALYTSLVTISEWADLGIAVAISGDGTMVAMGSYTDDAGGLQRGSVYTARFVGGTWTVEKRLTGFQDTSRFGGAVSLSYNGSTLLIGAPHENGAAGMLDGAAYVYTYVGGGSVWVLEQIISSTTFAIVAQVNNLLGTAVSLSADGNTAAIGVPTRYDHGVAEMFTRVGTTWSYQSIIERVPLGGGPPYYGETYVLFGYHLSLSNDGLTLAVGGPSLDGAGVNRGSVYIYTYTGSWAEHTALQPGVTAGIVVQNSADFGIAVAMSGDGMTCDVGAYKENSGGSQRGAIYKFVLAGTTWTMETRYAADGAGPAWSTSASAHLGKNVDVGDRGFVTGQYAVSMPQSSQGVAYIDV